MTKLRQKMIRAMDLRNLSKHTQRGYLAAVTGLAKHYRKSPEKITNTMIEDYLLYLKNEKKKAPNTCCAVLAGLRFFYTHILDRQISVDFSLTKKPRRLPTVLTKESASGGEDHLCPDKSKTPHDPHDHLCRRLESR
jgi:integrase/recombinase XerD